MTHALSALLAALIVASPLLVAFVFGACRDCAARERAAERAWADYWADREWAELSALLASLDTEETA